MAELANCSRCGNLFAKEIRVICPNCYKEEEIAFETVHRFLLQQKNREATIPEIVENTGVDEETIIKFVKEKRLHPSQFPKLTYPCEKCGTNITKGKLCNDCSKELRKELDFHEEIKKLSGTKKEKDRLSTYYVLKDHKNRL
ncbi:TIGR03826 family flagellar region protein [Virgibacillus ainsalahensis]